MKKIVMVLAAEKFRDIEYLVPRAFFEQHNIEIVTSSTTPISTGRFGYVVKNDLLNHQINESNFDSIFLVGGIGSLQYLEDDTLKNIFFKFLHANKPIAAICAAPRNFVSWGLMEGKKVTAHNGDLTFDSFALKYGALPVTSEQVVIDSNIITGNGPEASEATALKLIEVLNK